MRDLIGIADAGLDLGTRLRKLLFHDPPLRKQFLDVRMVILVTLAQARQIRVEHVQPLFERLHGRAGLNLGNLVGRHIGHGTPALFRTDAVRACLSEGGIEIYEVGRRQCRTAAFTVCIGGANAAGLTDQPVIA